LRSHLHHIKTIIKSLITNPGFKKYFFNTGWMFAEKILRLIAGLFIGAYVARYLGPSQYGLLNYAISLVTLFTVLSYLGLEAITIRELVKNEDGRDTLLGTTFILRLSMAIAIVVSLVIAVQLTDTDSKTRTLIYIIAAGAIFEVFGVIDYFFQSKVWSKYSSWSQMIALSLISILRVLSVIWQAPLYFFALISLIDLSIFTIGLIFFYSKDNLSISSWKFNWNLAKSLLKISWPMMISSFAITIYMKIDQVMIKWMLGDAANGIYGVAVRLTELWNFIPLAICASLFPAILNAKSVSVPLYLSRLQMLYDLMVVISIAIAIPTTFLSTYVVKILYGDAYSEGGNILTIYIWSSVFVFLSVANGKWIISENLQIFRMISLLGAALINIILNYFLIQLIGLPGAAVSTLISYAFASYFSFLLTKKTRIMFVSMTRSFNPLRLIQFFLKSR
jgi:O-antigen/teichoic acid export membrane protein